MHLEQMGDFLKRGMQSGGGKAKRKSISGKLLQDPNIVSFISRGPAVKYSYLSCASPGMVTFTQTRLQNPAKDTHGGLYLAIDCCSAPM